MLSNRRSVVQSQLHVADLIWQEISRVTEPADRWLRAFFLKNRKKFGSRDRRFLTEVIFTCFRHKTLLESLSSDLPLPVLAAAKEGLISEVDFKSMAPMALGADPRVRPGPWAAESLASPLPLKYSFPEWLVERWSRQFGASEINQVLEALNQRPDLVVRVNPLKASRETLLKRYQKKHYDVAITPHAKNGIIFRERLNLRETEEYKKGWIEIQDEGSQRVCEAMNPKSGEWIWDVCAGGGGKALYLAALMKNKGTIVATDIRSNKYLELKKRAQRAGVTNIQIKPLQADGHPEGGPKKFDKILVDAPCSGTGTLRRNPDQKWKLTEEKLNQFHFQQVQLIENALKALNPGGQLYYATCSIDKIENEDVVQSVLKKNAELQQVGEFLKLWPHRDGTDGFFVAVLSR